MALACYTPGAIKRPAALSSRRASRRTAVSPKAFIITEQAPPAVIKYTGGKGTGERLKVAINGFGRIGRNVLRHTLEREDVEVVAVNDPFLDAEYMAYLLRYDTVHGRLPMRVHGENGILQVGDHRIKAYSVKEPQSIPWGDDGAAHVLEATGVFVDPEQCQAYLKNGVTKKVVISAPAKGSGAATFVVGVNHQDYDPAKHQVVSNASCTTNGLAPLCKVLNDKFGIEKGLMTTVHAVTASQKAVDGSGGKKDQRGGRAAYQNIVPASTGAAKAVSLVLPELKGKLTGMAFRIPVPNVSVVDLTVSLKNDAPYDQIIKALEEAEAGPMKGVLGVVHDAVVSSDMNHDSRSCIVDAQAGIQLDPRFVKMVAWYDNEWGYSCRCVDLMAHMANVEAKV
jgi:glyceraldehyde 3-phosphate dehydrogenase